MTDRYMFTNDERGMEIRANLKAGLLSCGRTVEEGEETLLGFEYLTLTVTGKRPGEGQIAASIKGLRRKPLL